MLVAADGTCLVVDPGVTRREVATLAHTIAERGWRPLAVWSTHDHWDHRLDGPGFAGLPRWGAGGGGTHDELARQRDEDDELRRALGADDEPAPIGPHPLPYPRARTTADGWAVLDWPGPRVLVAHHRAHAPGHTALHLPDVGVLVAGDMLSDVEIPLLDDTAVDPVADYRAALDLLARAAATFVVPGHGTVGRGSRARAAADRAYLDALVAASRPDDVCDTRLTAAWLRTTHRRQHAVARAGVG
ncbi:MBL fold metallo-hydrolase [Cellulomonas sp. DKR-3]|uniref:MBL fold metallo-hydrolase n=1 Tax=Cellulomonas fulva TaxID=2835530 RepID=A0ABS5U076_9CELL|nr:MBL fold metallo-hydrolase [Cellulomonas fulva]MBT0994813.1 MBL fold metallo-hydrolase [Cellulomonas fulva]